MQFNPLKSIGLAKLLEGKGTLDDAVFLDEATGLYVLPQRPDDNRTVSLADSPAFSGLLDALRRSEERRVRNECVRTCRYRWSADPDKKTILLALTVGSN